MQKHFGWVGLVLAMVACSGGKVPVEDSPFAGLDPGKADGAWTNVKWLGELEVGGELKVSYSKKPRYRGVSFVGRQGAVLDIWVRSRTGDPVAYLLDDAWKVVAKNDDAAEDDTDSHLHAQINYNGIYRIVFRDYDLKSGKFTISLDGSVDSDAVAAAKATYLAIATSDNGLDPHAYSGSVPTGVEQRRQELSGLGFGADTYKLTDDAGQTIWALTVIPGEEMFTVDLFDAGGTLLAHGYSGDGGPDITYWEPTPWDPTIPH